MRNFIKKIVVILSLLLSALSLIAQNTPPTLPEEAPETLFSTNIDDNDVKLFASGSWNIRTGFAIGYLIDEDGNWIYGYMPDNTDNGFFYQQEAALFLSLLFMDRLFLDIVLTDNMEDNRYITGYIGKEDETIRNISIGNDRIAFKNSYRYMDISAQSPSDIGIYGLFATNNSEHEIILRLDSTSDGHVRYIGTSLAEEKYLNLYQYIRGRFFILPDTNIDFLTVYIEDEDGTITAPDGSKFRKATEAELSYSLSEGTLQLNTAASTRIAVFYQSGGKDVGDSSLGRGALCGTSGGFPDPTAGSIDFDWSLSSYMGYNATDWQIKLEGKNCLLVYIPSGWTPFEDLSHYTNNGAQEVRIVENGSTTTSSIEDDYIIKNEEYIVSIYAKDIPDTSPASRYPLSKLYPKIYGPYAINNSNYPSHKLLLLSLSSNNTITAPRDAVPESIRVYVNGREERNVQIDPSTLQIDFPYPINSYDKVDIYYRTKKSSNYNDFLAASGNMWTIGDNAYIKFASMLRYPISDIQYASTAQEAKADIISSVEGAYQGKILDTRADMGLIYSITNTTGYIRLFSSDNTSTSLSYSTSIYPAAPPEDTSDSMDQDWQLTGIGISGLDAYNRGILYYKDFYQYTSYGRGSLQEYTWSPPTTQIADYADGQKPGPYIASASTEGKSDAIMVMDFLMQSSEEWIGAQLAMPDNTGEINSISLDYKVAELVTSGGEQLNIYLQVGFPSEDIDDDRIIDEETSSYSAGFDFYDVAHDVRMVIGTDAANLPDMVKQSEDIDGNGILDKENQSTTTTFLLAQNISSVSGWNSIDIKIPEAFRARISSARAIRIIITRNTTGITTSGKILFTPPVINSSSFYTTTEDSDAQINSISISDTSLTSSSDLVKNTFSYGNTTQKVTEISWKNLDTHGFTAKTGITEIDSRYYKKISFYAKSDSSITIDVTIGANSTESIKASGISLSADSTWHLIDLDIKNRTVYVDNSIESSASISYTPLATSLNLLTIETSIPSSTSGTLYLDELYASEPENSLSLISSLDIRLNTEEDLLTYGTTSIIGQTSITQNISTYYEILPDTITSLDSSTILSSSIWIVLTEIYLDISTYDNYISRLGAGHNIKIPIGIASISENFYHIIKSTQNTSHDISIAINTEKTKISLSHNMHNKDTTQKKIYTLDTNTDNRPVTLDTKTKLTQTRDPIDTINTNYPEAYATSWQQIIPYTDKDDIQRSTELEIIPGFLTNNTKTALEAKIKHTSLPQLSEQNTQEELKLSSTIEVERITLSPYYLRHTETKKSNQTTSYIEDWEQALISMQEIPLILSTIPFYELWQDKEDIYAGIPSPYTKTSHKAETGIQIERPPFPGIADLFVPQSAGISLGTTYTKTGDSLATNRSQGLKLAFLATNLFGSTAAKPLTEAYTMDEFSRSLDIKRTTQVESLQTTWQIDWTETISLFTRIPRGLNLTNTLSLTLAEKTSWSNTSQLALTWTSPAPSWANNPPIEAWQHTPPELEHTENLSLITESNTTGDMDYTISVTHTTGLVYGTSGRFNLYFNNTIQKKDKIMLIGWILGANLTLQF
ncbi:hypothetical protein WKV44_05520 [Spirochaetia bacterium 38H-sp]|uniref:Uncharacterized protein n=1 Tax=Rarispira pelagica TaxID=3141764 RepID=A0ABU9UBF7_9SPIR